LLAIPLPQTKIDISIGNRQNIAIPRGGQNGDQEPFQKEQEGQIWSQVDRLST
jgi:hypothetical protein